MPFIERNATFNEMISESGYTKSALAKWFVESLGISAPKYFKNKEQESLKKEFAELKKRGFSDKELADYYKHSLNWVNNKSIEFGLKISRKELNNKLSKNVQRKVQAGMTVDAIAESMNCSYTKTHLYIKKNITDDIIKYRHENNILLEHKDKAKQNYLRYRLAKYFAQGKNVAETAKLWGIPKSRVSELKKLFGLKTKKDIAIEFMEKYLPDMIKADWSITKMANLIELSKATIRRRIKKLIGFDYHEIKNII